MTREKKVVDVIQNDIIQYVHLVFLRRRLIAFLKSLNIFCYCAYLIISPLMQVLHKMNIWILLKSWFYLSVVVGRVCKNLIQIRYPLHCIPGTGDNSLLTQESWILLSWVKDASHEAHMYISVFCYKWASGEEFLSYLRPIKLSWVKWELSSMPAIQCRLNGLQQEHCFYLRFSMVCQQKSKTWQKYWTISRRHWNVFTTFYWKTFFCCNKYQNCVPPRPQFWSVSRVIRIRRCVQVNIRRKVPKSRMLF